MRAGLDPSILGGLPSIAPAASIMSITCRPVLADTASRDSEGCMIFRDERLVAVVVRIEPDDDLDPALWGQWNLEAGFGPCRVAAGAVFPSCDAAKAWALRRSQRDPGRATAAE